MTKLLELISPYLAYQTEDGTPITLKSSRIETIVPKSVLLGLGQIDDQSYQISVIPTSREIIATVTFDVEFEKTLLSNLITVEPDGIQTLIEIDPCDEPIKNIKAPEKSPQMLWKLGVLHCLFNRMQSLELPVNLNLIRQLVRLLSKAKQYKPIPQLGQMMRDHHLFEGYYIDCVLNKQIQAQDLIQQGVLNSIITYDIEPKHINVVLNCLNKQTYAKNPIYYYFDQSSQKIQKSQLPYNFSWYEHGKLAGSSVPDFEDLQMFAKMGLKHVITCLETPLPYQAIEGLKVTHFEVDDRKPPTLEQLEQMLDLLDEGKPSVVHCQGGRGRTNVVIVCHLIRTQNVDAQTAIAMVKDKRPNLILDDCQVEFITHFAKLHLSSLDDSSSSGPIQPGTIKPKIKLPKLIMFVGLQASGKTTISKHMQEHFGDRVVRINQDELRHDSLDAFQDEAKTTKTIILDCCNLTADKRKEWLGLAFNAQSWCIFVDTPYEECQYRIVRRKGHQTIQEGGGLKVLESAIKKLEVPTLKEGFKRMFHLTKESEIDHFLLQLGLPKIPISSGIHKFRRTPHLIRLGSATPDDEDCSPVQQNLFLQSVIEIHEKVDGANLGFSINEDGKVIAQNRSHHVCSTYHPQFKLLDKWIAKHTDEIFSILEPEIEILFGEWLYMKHSIHYTKLPDYFMAFDIYNRKTNRYMSRNEMEKRLAGTSIVMVPLIAKKQFKSIDEIKALVRQPSQFYAGPIEGLYLRICDPTTTLEYAKIVRSDFICGNDQGKVRHWCKEVPVINQLATNY
jgi:atypical dual specificity phosphatase